MNKKLIYIFVLLIIIAGILFFLKSKNNNTVAPVNNFSFYCTSGTIVASFSSGTVSLVLSDGRNMTLPEEVSGSGIRYGSSKFEFLSKGDNAFVTEDGKNTYENCVTGKVSEVDKDINQFQNQSGLFSFKYPKIFSISGGDLGYTQMWRQNTTTLGTEFVVFSIPKSYQPQTNFGDAKFTVGASSDPDAVAKCLVGDGYGEKIEQVTVNGINYTKLNYSDAGAGNFYDVTSYRTIRDSQCYAIEYTIHSMNIGNYSPDQGIKEFDKIKIQSILDGTVNSFSF